MSARNPGLVYLSVSGFGQTGPMSQLPATDVVLQAFTGLMAMNKERDGTPKRIDMVLVDVITGLYGFQAISTALLERQRFGAGKYIDCSLMQSAIAFQTPKIVEHVLHGEGGVVKKVPVGTLPTQDGWMAVGVMNDAKFAALCGAIGRDDLATHSDYATMSARIAHEEALLQILRTEFRKHASSELTRRLGAADVLTAEVLDYAGLLAQPQLSAVEAVSWVAQDGFDREVPIGIPPGAPSAAEAPMGSNERPVDSFRKSA